MTVLCETGAIPPSLISLVNPKLCVTTGKHLRAEMQREQGFKGAKTLVP